MTLANFPVPYPDELLYGIISRYQNHLRVSSAWIKQQLFSKQYYYSLVDLPTQLNMIMRNTGFNKYLDIACLRDGHTLYPFYCGFLGDTKRETVSVDMEGNGGSHMWNIIGYPYDLIKDLDSMKFCPKCIIEDMGHYGEPYWHRIHRAPGVLVCPKHNVFLRTGCPTCGEPFVLSPHKYLALHGRCSNGHDLSIFIDEDIRHQGHFLSYAENVSMMLDGAGSFNPVLLKKACVDRLKELGMATHKGQVRWQEFSDSFSAHFGKEFLSAMGSLVAPDPENNWLFHGIRDNFKGCHPTRVILLIQYLFGTIRVLMEHLKKGYRPFGDGPWPCLNRAASHYMQRVVTECQVTGHAALSRPVGLFKCDCGFHYIRTGPDFKKDDSFRYSQVRQFGDVWISEARRLFFEGDLSLTEIGSRLGVSKGTVFYYVKEYDSISHGFDEMRLKVRREKILTILKEKPDISRKQMCKRANKEYQWIYKYDKEWLDANIPPLSKNEANLRRTTYDWKQKDQTLCNSVIRIVGEIKNELGKPIKISRREIFRRMGCERPHSVKERNKLPETFRLLEEVVEATEDFQIRSAEWSAVELVARGEKVTQTAICKLGGIKIHSPKIKETISRILSRN